MTALLTADEAAALRVGVNVIVRPGDHCTRQHTAGGTTILHHYHSPQDWVALIGQCPDRRCHDGLLIDTSGGPPPTPGYVLGNCPNHAPDGRRIVPLYTERYWWCDIDDDEHIRQKERMLVGRGSIEVIPVVTDDRVNAWVGERQYVWVPSLLNGRVFYVKGEDMIELDEFDPLPVPGHDFGIVIDCVEVA